MKYIFLGKIHPERANVTISDILLEIGTKESSLNGKIYISIKLSQVVVELETESKLPVIDLRNTIENFTNTIVDVYGYLKGYAYSVELFSVYIPEIQKNEIFGVDVAKINNDEKNRPLNFNDTLQTALKHPELHMVLKDLRDAIKRPLDTFFHCRRATETIMKYFMKSGNKAKGWEDAIKFLQLNEADIDAIKNSGGGQRHGEYASVTGEQRVEIMMKTWKVVDKFIEYLSFQES